jgi:hypothetical protein
MENEPKKDEPSHSLLTDLSKIPLVAPDEGVFSAYSNIINMDWTLYDVRIRFAELTQIPDEEDPVWGKQHQVMLERVVVRMPWHQAKMLRDMLDEVVRAHEAVNGELKPLKLAQTTADQTPIPPIDLLKR